MIFFLFCRVLTPYEAKSLVLPYHISLSLLLFRGLTLNFYIFGFFRVLTPYEAKSLVALLHSKDCDVLERVLVTVSNSAAFTANQVSHFKHIFRLLRLKWILITWSYFKDQTWYFSQGRNYLQNFAATSTFKRSTEFYKSL